MSVPSISIEAMIERMRNGESYVILDIRSKSEFQNWQIKGLSLQAINIPYFDFKENEVNDNLIPEWSHVVVLSVDEPAAQKVAAKLADKGYEVSCLAGGFAAWESFYLYTPVIVNPKMKLIQVNRVATGCLSYAIVTGGQVIIVDPSRHIDRYLEIAERENAKITYVIDTHVHSDHISGAMTLLKKTSAEYLVPHGEIHKHDVPVTLLGRGTVHIGSLDIHVEVLDTEGETGGNTLLVLDNQCVLSGDAVAVGEVGIADLPGSAHEWAEKLFNTVLREIKSLADDIFILPAHYADIQAINPGGYVGAVLGDIRLGAEAMARVKELKFGMRPAGFVSVFHPVSDDIRRVNVGLLALDEGTASELEDSLRGRS